MKAFAVCSEKGKKPVTRAVYTERTHAEDALAALRQHDADAQITYWIAELGPECEGWRHFFTALPSPAG